MTEDYGAMPVDGSDPPCFMGAEVFAGSPDPTKPDLEVEAAIAGADKAPCAECALRPGVGFLGGAGSLCVPCLVHAANVGAATLARAVSAKRAAEAERDEARALAVWAYRQGEKWVALAPDGLVLGNGRWCPAEGDEADEFNTEDEALSAGRGAEVGWWEAIAQ